LRRGPGEPEGAHGEEKGDALAVVISIATKPLLPFAVMTALS
jgi:hypothetical protein